MRRNRFSLHVFLSLLAALLLVPAVSVLAQGCGTSAHPSGNDRCVEEGGSGTQGDAQADPDDDTRGPERTPQTSS